VRREGVASEPDDRQVGRHLEVAQIPRSRKRRAVAPISRSANGIARPRCRTSVSIFAASWAIALVNCSTANGVQLFTPIPRLLFGNAARISG
jgi:hypothetical protein